MATTGIKKFLNQVWLLFNRKALQPWCNTPLGASWHSYCLHQSFRFDQCSKKERKRSVISKTMNGGFFCNLIGAAFSCISKWLCTFCRASTVRSSSKGFQTGSTSRHLQPDWGITRAASRQKNIFFFLCVWLLHRSINRKESANETNWVVWVF